MGCHFSAIYVPGVMGGGGFLGLPDLLNNTELIKSTVTA